ncbi:MAG TPA: hypothetical protein PKH09_15795, partial [Parvularculaceae bacterium]|nr:hypothetical protein [Parvularculaceae bacterium]
MAVAGSGLKASRGGALSGAVSAPGDKSISHRALIFGALARGETIATGLLEGQDVLRTAAAMRALGARVERDLAEVEQRRREVRHGERHRRGFADRGARPRQRQVPRLPRDGDQRVRHRPAVGHAARAAAG